jgi:hypothetical protein
VSGATSYDDLRTVNGVILPIFCEAAERRGLIEVDNSLDECIAEATLYQILVFCEPSDVCGLWNRHLDAMSEDYRRNVQSTSAVG